MLPLISRTVRRKPNVRQLYCQSQLLRGIASGASQHAEVFDVVCVGGGPAGLSLLNALRSSSSTADLKVALIESQDLTKGQELQKHAKPDQYSNRCSSLTPTSVHFLNEIGAWQHVDKSRVQPYEEMKVWDGVSGSSINFDWASAGTLPDPDERTVAYMIENNNLTSGLLTRARELGGMSLLEKSRVESIELGEDTGDIDFSSWPMVQLADGRILAARLLVGADGPNSLVRSFAGISSDGWDYERHGVVATLQLELPDSHAIAYQRFLPTGPIAMLPLPNGLASLVWSTLPSHAALLKSLSSDDLTAMVNAAFRLSPVDLAYFHTMPPETIRDELAWRTQHTSIPTSLVPPLVAGVQPSTPASFPLRMRHAAAYTGVRVALVGDAAHTIHPLAGQGLNLGQADVAALAATLADAADGGADIGDQLALEPYPARRFAANYVMLGVVDKLHKLYSVESGPLVGLRSWGLAAVDAMAPLKGFLMSQAAGKG